MGVHSETALKAAALAKGLFQTERPVLARRGAHLDLKGLPPTPARLLELLDLLAAARYNILLVEWEDAFPWTVDQRFRSPTAYTAEEVRRFAAAAAQRAIEIIPLVQCLGHMETPLSVPGYERLREVPDDPSVLNSLAPGARELIDKMVADVLALLPEVRHFHLGGDEAWSIGAHPDTKAYIAQHGKGALYLQHVGPILDRLNARGIRPILWHDMMIHWDSAALRALAPRSDLMVWGYSGHPDATVHHFNTRHIRRFAEHGLTLWGGTAFKGADHRTADLPDFASRQENAEAWVEVARRCGLVGVIATGWSRVSTHALQFDPLDAALDSLINLAVILHDGKAPPGGQAACAAALDAIGEGQRFRACQEAVSLLAAVRKSAWEECQHLKELKALARLDPGRASAASARRIFKYLRNIMNTGQEAEGKVRQAFAGLVNPLWIEEYLGARLAPLRDERREVTRLWSDVLPDCSSPLSSINNIQGGVPPMPKKKIPVAIQLYSLRDVAPKDVPGTLRQVAAMGYQGVEFAGYYNLDAAVLRKMLDDCGLRCAGSHTGLNVLEGAAFDQTVAANQALGNNRLIVPNADLQDLATTITRLNAAHARAKACGMRVGYHNHTREFELIDGVTKFERLFSETPADFLVQVDIGWATCAGQDVPAILRKYARRIETVHVKEFSPGNPQAAVGEGSVQWPAIFDILEKETSVAWYIVEQEKFTVGPLESAKTGIDYIRKLGR